MKPLRDLLWIIPSSLVLGWVLSMLGPGTIWIGWLAYSILLILGLLALSALWRSAGSGRALGWMLVLAVVLRLGMGIFFSYVLPVYGNDTEVHDGGYSYRDAFTYDRQAWELAASGDPLWKAFDRSYGIEEQYGGLTLTLSLTYRLLSPDAHRTWLPILLSALVAAMGVALAWKAAHLTWGKSMALGLGWIMALYPEAILLGSSHMREPYLITFVAMAFWGVTSWTGHHRSAVFWMIGSLVGMLLFSPGIAVASIILLSGWIWLRRKERRIRWWWIAAAGMLVLLSFLLLAWIVGGSLAIKNGPLASLVDWMRYTVQFDSQKLELESGWVQNIFSRVPDWLHLPMIIGYGVAQPVLPSAIGSPAVWPMVALGIFRGIGWYLLLPLLLYSIVPIFRMTDKHHRLAWLWLWLVVWIWILISAARGGGDQWDNPRYRSILLVFQAVLAAQVILIERERHERWLGRLLAVEAVFVACFAAWTWTRKDVHPFVLPLGGTAVFFMAASLLILVGDWLWERNAHRRTTQRTGKN